MSQRRGDRFLDLANQGQNGLSFYLAALLLLWLMLLPLQFLPLQVASSANFYTSLRAYLLQNLPFVVLLLGLWLVLKKIHQRPLLTLITPHQQIDYKRVLQASGLWLLLSAIADSLVFLSHPSSIHFTFQPLSWLLFLPFVLVCTSLQATIEELLFRGYGLQAAGQLTHRYPLLISLSGLLFAVAHTSNPEFYTSNHPIWAFSYYFACGSFPCLIALWEGSLELAIGWHIGNNLFVALFLQPATSTLQTPAVWREIQPYNFQTGLALFLIQAILFGILLLQKPSNLPAQPHSPEH